MKKICELMKEAENKWLHELLTYNKSLFLEKNIPSHDEFHHFRVWKIARNLVESLADKGFEFESKELEAMLIAVFFHDTGLTITIDENHGKASR